MTAPPAFLKAGDQDTAPSPARVVKPPAVPLFLLKTGEACTPPGHDGTAISDQQRERLETLAARLDAFAEQEKTWEERQEKLRAELKCLLAAAETEKPGTPAAPAADTQHPVTARLRRVAIVHQRAAISRAMRLASVHGQDRPSLDDLDRAENPPAPRWRWNLSKPPVPTEDDIRAAAAVIVRTPAWRMGQHKLSSTEQQIRAAMPDVASALFAAWNAMPDREMTNREKWEAGQRHAERWRPVLDALRRMLDAVNVRVPDAWLSAISEDDLKAAAAAAAQLGLLTTPAGDMDTPDAKKARCPMHHRRALRRRAATARQHLAALLGTIGAGGAPYADAYAVSCWRERQKAAAFFGMNRVLLFEDGTQVPLWDVMESSRKARLATLYVQMLAVDDLAQRREMVPVFITMTLPPRHHPNPKHGLPYDGLDWQDAPNPDETDAALAGQWARFRTRLSNDRVALLGPRVIEPHQDGCPHLHALLYVQSMNQAALMDEHLQAVCSEPIAGKRIASKLEYIDRAKGSPATYIMKYLLKCLPAHEEAAEQADGTITDGDPDHLAHHAECQAWGSERRLRRFDWLGLHGLRTVWQRVRAMTEDEVAAAPDPIQKANAAMKAGAWGDALEALGAVRAFTNTTMPRKAAAAAIAAAWNESSTGPTFAAALAEHGMKLALSPQRPVMAVDNMGHAHEVWRALRNAAPGMPAPTAADVRLRVAGMNLDPVPPRAGKTSPPDRPRLTYVEKKNAYGELVKRPDGVALGDWRIPLRRRTCHIVKPQHAPENRTPQPQAGADSTGVHTVRVSCPRSRADGGVNDGGTGRTGPPTGPGQDRTPETTSCCC